MSYNSSRETIASMAIKNLPRAHFLHWQTPIERQFRLSDELKIDLQVKRDDLTGLAFGGNKVRQLEFYFGKILAANADTVLITGAIQSNYTRVVAACAARLNVACHMLLEDRVSNVDATYRTNGNVFVNRFLGATLHFCSSGESEENTDQILYDLADKLRRQGRRPYVIPLGPKNPPIGSLGYICCADELIAQSEGFDYVVVASGSGHTQSGLLFGLRSQGWKGEVHGICVRREALIQKSRISAQCEQISDMLGIRNPVMTSDIYVHDDAFPPGYGSINCDSLEVIKTCARLDGLILDPVYTGRAMNGLFHCVRDGRLPQGSRVLFVHTGGLPALFAYASMLAQPGTVPCSSV
ncbi:D-cysteine desulfhydrase family protein [Afipia felis]